MQTFQIATATARALWLLLPIAAIPLVIIGVVILMVISGMRARFEVSPAGLRLTGDF